MPSKKKVGIGIINYIQVVKLVKILSIKRLRSCMSEWKKNAPSHTLLRSTWTRFMDGSVGLFSDFIVVFTEYEMVLEM